MSLEFDWEDHVKFHPTRRRAIILGGSAIAASMLSRRTAYAQEITLRAGHVLAPSHPFHLGLQKAADVVLANTSGRIKIEVFPSAQLGAERDMNVALRTGGIDMLLGSPGSASVHYKPIGVLAAPYLFRDNAHWQGVVYGDVGREWNEKIVEASGIHIVGYFHRGVRHVASRTQPYDTLGAIANQKIRVADVPPGPQVFAALGATPTPIAFAEMYQALETGTVDGSDTPLDGIVSQKLFEVCKFVTLISWSFASPGPIMISQQAWSQLTDADQKIVIEAMRQGSELVTDAMTNGEEAMKKQLSDAGMTFVTPTDLDAWREAAAKSIPEVASTWGGDVDLYYRIRDAKS
jgi:TRAP-type transport system periplasmic protein